MSPRRSLLVRIVPAVLVTAATWCGAAAAPAATVSIPEDDEHGVDHVVFTGDPGEANDLTVTLAPKNAWYEPREIRFTDAGAPLTPGRFCTAVDLHTVTCVPEMTYVNLEVQLGDGDDRLRAAATIDAAGGPGDDQLLLSAARTRSWLAGGEGDDVVVGGAGKDSLSGGPGLDELQGGAGRDTLAESDDAAPSADLLDGGDERDTLSYEERTTRVAVDLARGNASHGAAGEHDTARAIEDVIGGTAADALTGSAGANRLDGGDGADVLHGLGGDDALLLGAGADSAEGGAGDDRLWALEAYGRKDDGAADRLLGGDGDDQLDVGADETLVDAGAGDDLLWATMPRSSWS